MDRLNKLDVYYHDQKIGTMALYQNRLAAFAYSDEWLQEGFSISPFSLPLEKRVFMPKIDPFEGLFGGKRQIMRLVELTFLCQTLKNTKKLIVF